ncbi:alpha/beta hydrolase [Streptomyces sp. 549]|uniref:alpha/beta fold hydrolase n=1 Tax=Streptomyces sp. 549 TaxID=3049076 RepID=UPI0024C22E2D|nr:alpha/beta hydrolase [Streptomyces sp. 549]MDK1472484.1 alpha/beta hydrolase [Streptomyces sp. 549]
MTDLNGTPLYHRTEGDGPTVVLVHGSWTDGDSWAGVVPLLAERCSVTVYDRRGHSRSESAEPPGQGSVHEDVEDLAALIHHLELGPVHVCGNSYGALITLRLAAAHPDLVRALTVHEPPGVRLLEADPATKPLADGFRERVEPVRALLEAGDGEAAAERFVETVAFGLGGWRRLPEPVRASFVRNGPTFLDELRDPDCLGLDLAALHAFPHPALLTRSDDSPPMFAPVLDLVAAFLPQAERHTYSGAGHAPHAGQPEEYAQVTLRHILAGT